MIWPFSKIDKAQTSSTPMLTAEMGITRRYGIPTTGSRLESASQLVRRYSLWVYLCTNINAKVAASIPIRLFAVGQKDVVEKAARFRPKKLDRRTKSFLSGSLPIKPSPHVRKAIAGYVDDMTEITEHPILDLLNDVNPQTEGFEFRRQMYVDMQIFGEHWWQVIEQGSQPTELWRMRPQIIKIFPGLDSERFIEKIEYGTGATVQTLMPDEFVRFVVTDPDDPWSAFGPLSAWLKTADASYAIQAFQEDLMARGGSPDWLLVSKGALNDDVKRGIVIRWREKFGRMWGRREHVMVATGDLTPHKLNATNRELEFSASETAKRDQICAAFGVPRAFVDSERIAANSREAMNQYKMLTICPMYMLVEQVINQRFIPRYWSERLIVCHDNPYEEDRTIRIQERASKLGAGYSINELRVEDGDEPLADPAANEPMIGPGFTPLSQMQEKHEAEMDAIRNPPQAFGGTASSNDKALHVHVDGGHSCPTCSGVKALPESVSMKALWIKAQGEADRPYQDRGTPGFRAEIDDAMVAQAESVVGVMRATNLPQSAIDAAIMEIRNPKWVELLTDAARPFIETSVEVGGKAGLSTLRATENVILPEGVGFDVTNARVQAFVDQHAVRLASSVNGTTEVAARELLGDGMAKGESVDDLANRIEEWTHKNPEPSIGSPQYRARMIARTESSRACVRGTIESWKQSGVVSGRKWLLGPDPCPICEALAAEFNAKATPLDAPFISKGGSRTIDGKSIVFDYADVDGGDAHPNCACDIVPVFMESSNG